MKKIKGFTHILDYSLLNKAFTDYKEDNYLQMIRLIKEYGEFDFFIDLLQYLNFRYSKESHRHFIYHSIVEIYFAITMAPEKSDHSQVATDVPT